LNFGINFVRLVGGAILMLFGFLVSMKPPGGEPYIQIAGLAGGCFGLLLILNPRGWFTYRGARKDKQN
jgi:hypothetical protein